MELELCIDCDEPTGNAGINDDSLYTETSGPYCEKCYNKLIQQERDSFIVLKKCPCCGGDPRCMKYKADSNEHPFSYFSDRYAIQCKYTGKDKGCGLESGHYKTINEAVESWNRREV